MGEFVPSSIECLTSENASTPTKHTRSESLRNIFRLYISPDRCIRGGKGGHTQDLRTTA